MRVATFNILHGRSPSDGRVDPDRLADAVRELDVDVLALQEVDRGQSRSDRLDLTAVAQEAMGAVDGRFVAALSGEPGGWTAATDREEATGYGVALLSRLPVRSWRVVRLPALGLPVPVRFRGRRPVLVRDEPRVAVLAVVDSPLGQLAVAATHLSFLPGWNAWQLRRLRHALADHRGPALIAGDLNMSPGVARRTTGYRPLAIGLTFPADAPRRQIDHLLGRGIASARDPRVHALPVSDHRALSVEIG